ncbi:MAG: hypothetical protein R6U58_06435 [Bacteroidales bacterium]
MDYLTNILWLLSWPVVIFLSYRASLFALRIFESNAGREEKQNR